VDLFTYYRSTSSYRVRIALALKGLAFDAIPVNLIRDGGDHHTPEYLAELSPQPALLPDALTDRARHRQIAALIGCDIHPLHNVAVLNRLRGMGHDEGDVTAWIGHWIGEGFAAVEALIGDSAFCFGAVGLADVYLLPQAYTARRFNVDMGPYPRIRRVEALALQHPAFQTAHPDAQSDKPE
jgi:maleylacetoacetate isomerase